MSKYVEFITVYGKLGNHPGTLTGEQALGLYNQGMSSPAKAKLLDYYPDGGRSTVLLSAVAQNIEGELAVEANWQFAPYGAEMWYERAVKLHKIKAVPLNGTAVDFAVVRASIVPALNGKLPRASRLFVYGDLAALPNLATYHPVANGPGWMTYEAIIEH